MAWGAMPAPAAEPASPEWQALVAAAQREGKVEVNLGGQMPRKLAPAMATFQKKYGIKVNYKTGGSSAHRIRMFADRKLGRYTVDIWIGGANGALADLLPNKLLVPMTGMLVDPAVTDPSKWFKDKIHYSDPEQKYIVTWGASPSYNVAINTKLVKPDEIKSYADLLDPKWKGKIVSWSPDRSGSGAGTVPMFLNPKIGETWFRRWAKEMDVTIVRDSRQGAEWLALGRFSIGMFGLGTQVKEMAGQGFPVQDYLPHPMAEGEVLSASAANIYLIKDAPNPNAMKLFLNWVLSRDAQQELIKLGQTSDSLRRDVDNSVIEPQYRIDRARDYYVAFSDPLYQSSQREVLGKLKSIMRDARVKK